jgi:hypothetical protein
MLGTYDVRSPNLKARHSEAKRLRSNFDCPYVDYSHISRSGNDRADWLAGHAMCVSMTGQKSHTGLSYRLYELCLFDEVKRGIQHKKESIHFKGCKWKINGKPYYSRKENDETKQISAINKIRFRT